MDQAESCLYFPRHVIWANCPKSQIQLSRLTQLNRICPLFVIKRKCAIMIITKTEDFRDVGFSQVPRVHFKMGPPGNALVAGTTGDYS